MTLARASLIIPNSYNRQALPATKASSVSAMTISMLDQLYFPLPCGHEVILGRLQGAKSWSCERCNKQTDLSESEVRAALVKELDTAVQIDLQAKERGEKTWGGLSRRRVDFP